jgi:hypothetical protein
VTSEAAVDAQSWEASRDPKWMLVNLPQRVCTLRRLRLFACACSRRVWAHFATPWRAAVELGERYADRQVSEQEMLEGVPATPAPPDSADQAAAWAVARATALRRKYQFARVLDNAAFAAAQGQGQFSPLFQEESLVQVALLRDIFGGPPWRPSIGLRVVPTDVVSLAEAAYDDRALPGGTLDPQRLAVLADALEEAGAGADAIGHLRGVGPHVRGCWVVDLCLGKS